MKRVLPPEMASDPLMSITHYDGPGGETLFQSDLRKARARAAMHAHPAGANAAFREQFIKDTNIDIQLTMARKPIIEVYPFEYQIRVLWKRICYGISRLFGARKKGWR